MVTFPVADRIVIILCVPLVFCKVILPGAEVQDESELKTALKPASVFETTVTPGGSVVTAPPGIRIYAVLFVLPVSPLLKLTVYDICSEMALICAALNVETISLVALLKR